MYQVYVVELRKIVFSDHKKFREANPQYNGVLECLYVGMSSKSPQERLKQHKEGILSEKGIDISSTIVKKFGSFLRPSLYIHLPVYKTQAEALKAEKNLAATLRKQRYAVWSN
jgi:predicted GIY-YIG superfamily endonuclease